MSELATLPQLAENDVRSQLSLLFGVQPLDPEFDPLPQSLRWHLDLPGSNHDQTAVSDGVQLANSNETRLI
jgi:hypothetical protein